jgi:hypothetical protein
MYYVIFLVKSLANYLEKQENDILDKHGTLAFVFNYLERITKLSKRLSVETDEQFIKIMHKVSIKFENNHYKDLDDVLKDLRIIYNIMKEIYVRQKVLDLLSNVSAVYNWEDKDLAEQLEDLISLINKIFGLKIKPD